MALQKLGASDLLGHSAFLQLPVADVDEACLSFKYSTPSSNLTLISRLYKMDMDEV